MTVFITIVIVLLLLFLGLATYNRLVRLRKNVQKGWRQLIVQLRRRHELVSDVAESMRAMVATDGGALDAMIAARNAAAKATGPVDASAKEGALSRSIARAISEVGHQAIPAHADVQALRERFAAADVEVASARRLYNQVATVYNTAAHVVPGNLIAGMGNFPRAELFEPAADTESASPAPAPS